MRVALGLGLAFGFFAASFALHIVGGATGQGWLFAIAVALIYISATGFPAIAMMIAGFRETNSTEARVTAGAGAAAGYAFTLGALWAANGRAFAWWEFPAAAVLVLISSAIIFALWRASGRREGTAARTAVGSRAG